MNTSQGVVIVPLDVFDATLILTSFSSLACDVRRLKQSIFGPLLPAKGVDNCDGQKAKVKRDFSGKTVGATNSQPGASLERSPERASQHSANFPHGLGSFSANCGHERRRPVNCFPASAGDVGGNESHHRFDLSLYREPHCAANVFLETS